MYPDSITFRAASVSAYSRWKYVSMDGDAEKND
jgi:hypothetical protein